jgi:hypothetical protein
MTPIVTPPTDVWYERHGLALVLPQSLRAMPRPWSHSQSTSQSTGM